MAKKQTAAKAALKQEVEPQMQATNEMTEVVIEKQKRKEKEYKTLEDGWEIKDRVYNLKGGKRPLSRSLKAAGVYYFDEQKGKILFCKNYCLYTTRIKILSTVSSSQKYKR